MDLQISLGADRDLAGQIYRQIRAAILDGRLAPGHALPATRELARRIGVARGTVGTAYERLSGDGLLEGRRGAGTFVSHRRPPAADPADAPAHGALRARAGWPRPQVWQVGPDVDVEFDFRTGIPDVRWFPFAGWRRILMRELSRPALQTPEYGDVIGLPALRAAISRHIGISRAVHAGPDQIVVTTGAQQALDLIARVLLAPGDRVAVEEPGYPPPRELFRSMGVDVVPVPVDTDGIVTDALPTDVRLVYVTPTHQHPLGVSMAMPRRRALLAWAAVHNVAIVEDDYDSEFRFDGRPLESLHSLDTDGRVLYVGTFSKTLMPSLRLGFVVVPLSLRRALATAKFVSDWHTNVANQATLAEFIDEGGFARHIRRMQVRYQARQERIMEVLDRRAGGVLTPLPAQAGLHITALMPPGTAPDTLPLASRARASGVSVYALSQMYAGPPTRAGFTIGFGAVDRSRIPAGIARLIGCLVQS